MNYLKRTELLFCSIFIALTFLLISVSAQEPSPFQDVDSEAYYASAASEMNELGVITGTAPGIFSPDAELKRADLVVMLYRMSGTPQTSDFLPFLDTFDHEYYSSALKWAVENGIITGKSEHIFGTGESISRQDLVLILYRMTLKAGLCSPGYTELNGFRDYELVSGYAQDALRWAVEKQILKGTEDGYLNPTLPTNRAQAAVLLSRWIHLYPSVYNPEKQDHPENAAYTIRSFNTGDLEGILYEPVNTLADTIIVMSHALGTNLHSQKTHASYLARNGYAAYCFEFHGQGDAGSPLEMSILTEMEDLNHAIENIRSLGYDHLYLYGESQGGIVSALEAENTYGLDGLILVYPAFSIPDMIRSLFPSAGYIPAQFNFVGNILGYRYAADVIYMDPYSLIGKSAFPVLIFHGENDSIVPISYSYRASELYPNCELYIYPGEGHGFSQNTVVQQMTTIIDWLGNHIR